MKKNKILRILAGVVAIALIGGVLFITNFFIGNPISAMMANRAIKEYVNENYSELDLEIEKAIYNFKLGAYMARVQSRTSRDTKFPIYYSNGRVQRDEYNNYVLGMYNTLQRLSEEYSQRAKELLINELDYKFNYVRVMYDKDSYGQNQSFLKLDMEFDKNLPLHTQVTLGLDLQDTTLETIAEVFINSHRVFKTNGYNFNRYNLYAENDGILVMVNGVTPNQIEEGQLISILINAKNQGEYKGVTVFIKGEKK